MRRQGLWLFVFAALFFGGNSAVFSAGKTGSVSGEVVLVKMVSKQIVVASQTQKDLPKVLSTFQVSEKTKLEAISGLAELKLGDWVTLDYFDSGEGLPVAERLAKSSRPSENSGA